MCKHNTDRGSVGSSLVAVIWFGCVVLGSLFGSGHAGAASCALPGQGETALESAANGLQPGDWCELATEGLNWSLIQPPGSGLCSNENHLEYGGEGVYDPARQVIFVATGPHSGTVTGGCYPENYVLIKYDEGSNTWSLEDQTTTGLPDGGHGYDLTSIDPTTGDVYVSVYNKNGLWRRNGGDGRWTKVGDNPIISCNGQTCASGSTWDIRRNGYLRFGDNSESGVTIWHKDEGNWSQLAPASEFGGFNAGYHYWAGYHRTSGIVWLHDGNGSSKHWRLNTDNSIEVLRSPPISLGCCGSNGRFTTYDFRTDRFVVADPYTNRFYDYDVEGDLWTSLGTKVPLDQSGAPEAFVTPIDAHGGVIMYVVGRDTGNDPTAYVYKHAGAKAPEQSTPEAPKDLGAN